MTFFSYSKMWLTNIKFKYLKMDYISKFRDNFKLNNKIHDELLVQSSSPKSDQYIFFVPTLLWHPYSTVAFCGCVQTNSNLQSEKWKDWASMSCPAHPADLLALQRKLSVMHRAALHLHSKENVWEVGQNNENPPW
jgi:hypothetical protein